MDFLDEMNQYIGRKKGKKEPDGFVTPERTGFPEMIPLHRFDGLMVAVNFKGKKDGIDNETNGAPYQIGDEQSFGFFGDVGLCVARNGFVEIASLEEEKAHEEERPCHHLFPPVVAFVATEGDGVESNHADDADTTQEVEGVITLFHGCKGKDFQ